MKKWRPELYLKYQKSHLSSGCLPAVVDFRDDSVKAQAKAEPTSAEATILGSSERFSKINGSSFPQKSGMGERGDSSMILARALLSEVSGFSQKDRRVWRVGQSNLKGRICRRERLHSKDLKYGKEYDYKGGYGGIVWNLSNREKHQLWRKYIDLRRWR